MPVRFASKRIEKEKLFKLHDWPRLRRNLPVYGEEKENPKFSIIPEWAYRNDENFVESYPKFHGKTCSILERKYLYDRTVMVKAFSCLVCGNLHNGAAESVAINVDFVVVTGNYEVGRTGFCPRCCELFYSYWERIKIKRQPRDEVVNLWLASLIQRKPKWLMGHVPSRSKETQKKAP